MKKVEIDDFAKIRKLSDLNLSPSSKKAAFVVTEGDVDKNGYNTDIYVYDPSHTPAFFRLTSSKNATLRKWRARLFQRPLLPKLRFRLNAEYLT
jgi:dipeptidyl aminopeptidase/acylaminoacyl peptidase